MRHGLWVMMTHMHRHALVHIPQSACIDGGLLKHILSEPALALPVNTCSICLSVRAQVNTHA